MNAAMACLAIRGVFLFWGFASWTPQSWAFFVDKTFHKLMVYHWMEVIMRAARLFVFCLFCFACAFSSVAIAQDNGAIDANTTDAAVTLESDAVTGVQPTEAYVSDENPAPVGEKSWQRGWDIRLDLGFKYYFSSRTPAAFNFGVDLGYRWKKVSLYLHFDNAVGPDKYGFEPVTYTYNVGLNNLYYIYLAGNAEMLMGFGVVYRSDKGLGLPLTIGFNWHIDDILLGFNFTYQPSVLFLIHGPLPAHELRANFVVGYTF